jgi:hypothetical protein
VAINTVARWETGRTPDLLALAKLERFASDNGQAAHANVFQALIDSQVGDLLMTTRNARIAAGRIKKAIDGISKIIEEHPELIPQFGPVFGDLNVALNRMWEIDTPKGFEK